MNNLTLDIQGFAAVNRDLVVEPGGVVFMPRAALKECVQDTDREIRLAAAEAPQLDARGRRKCRSSRQTSKAR